MGKTATAERSWGKHAWAWWMMSLLTFIMIVVLAFTGKAHAAEDEESSVVSFQSGVVSKFVDENGSVLINGPASQSELIVLLGDKGFYGYAWNSMGLNKRTANEIDLGFGRDGELVAGISCDAAVFFVNLEGLGRIERTDLWEPYVKLYKAFQIDDKNTVTPFVLGEYFFTNGTKQFDGGLYVHAGVEHSLKEGKVSLKNKLDILYDDGVFGFQRAAIGSYEGKVDYSFTKSLGVYGGVRLSQPLSSVSEKDGREFQSIASAGITLKF